MSGHTHILEGGLKVSGAALSILFLVVLRALLFALPDGVLYHICGGRLSECNNDGVWAHNYILTPMTSQQVTSDNGRQMEPLQVVLTVWHIHQCRVWMPSV